MEENDYYYHFIKQVLEEDVQKYFSTFTYEEESLKETIQNVISDYIKRTPLIFEKEREQCNMKDTKSHMYRSRVKYMDKENRCLARIWNEGMGGQCSCAANYDGFCKRHYEKGGYDWAFGTVDKPREREVLYKGKLHSWKN
tara:strand:- start:75 stop:497 length:423 start_codon:yes stop_codon:yes gene_type:complete